MESLSGALNTLLSIGFAFPLHSDHQPLPGVTASFPVLSLMKIESEFSDFFFLQFAVFSFVWLVREE